MLPAKVLPCRSYCSDSDCGDAADDDDDAAADDNEDVTDLLQELVAVHTTCSVHYAEACISETRSQPRSRKAEHRASVHDGSTIHTP